MQRSQISSSIILATLALACSAPALAQVGALAYDGFDNGPKDTLGGSTGGSGWTDAWYDFRGPYGSLPTVIGDHTTGLTFGNLSVSPGGLHFQAGALPDMISFGRSFPAPAGDALYASGLFRLDVPTPRWQVFRVGSYPNQVEFGVPSGSSNYGMRIGDTFVRTTNVPVTQGQTVFLVVQIRHDVGANTTVYSLYTNPLPGHTVPQTPAATFTRLGLVNFGSSVELMGVGGYFFDELRVGSTWESVTPATFCFADFNHDSQVDLFDYLDFVDTFSSALPASDVNNDGVIDFFDYLDFVQAFSTGC